MLLAILIGLLLGVVSGTLTGLLPGIHINLVSSFLLAFLAKGYFSSIEDIAFISFVVAMAITHTFIDFIPSIFLGAPEEDSFLSILPGHQLLKLGKGYEAAVMTIYGSITGLPLVLIFSVLFIFFLDTFYFYVTTFIPYILIFVSLYSVFREEHVLDAFIIFISAGFLGLATIYSPVRDPLLPLLTGLFGISGLYVSLKSKFSIPKQFLPKLRDIGIDRNSILKSVLAASVSAPISSFLPGAGSSQAAVIGSEFMGKAGKDNKTFLFLLGIINTMVMALSFVTVYTISKTRTGAAFAVKEIIPKLEFYHISIILVVVFLSGCLSFFIGIKMAKFFSININKINYAKISYIVIIFLFLLNIFLTNFYGLLVLVSASALGIYTLNSNVRRINLMGSLILPTIVFYLM